MNTSENMNSTSGNNSLMNGYEGKEAMEIQIPMPWGHVSGKQWGPEDKQPILAIHGWQDNAGTFDNLAKLLPNVALLSIDLPGHGWSSHLTDGQFYYVFWDGVMILRRIVKHYKWGKVSQPESMLYNDLNAINGKWWGSREIQPILALHGRQDNAGSFDTLMPLLCNDVSILCFDMPGHGLSSHYPESQFYYVYWDGVILLRRIVNHFKWHKVKLLGHSLGGAISFLYAASFPNEVDFIISLDIASPSVSNIEKIAAASGTYIDRFLNYESLIPDNVPCYEYNEMINIVEDAYNGSITKDAAKILMKRGMRPAWKDGQYFFSRDPKLKVSFLNVISLDLVLQYASQITCAYLNIRAVPGMKFEQPENYYKVLDKIKLSSERFEYHEVEGTHHVHLTEPEKVAPIIKNFLKD